MQKKNNQKTNKPKSQKAYFGLLSGKWINERVATIIHQILRKGDNTKQGQFVLSTKKWRD